jgi:uncharacterized protein (DUF608 family)
LPTIWRGAELETIGMPVGGIAAGQMYLCGDGTLGCWQIFNQDYFSGYGATNYQRRPPARPVDSGFVLMWWQDSGVGCRPIGRQGFRQIEFTGEHPQAHIKYSDADVPLCIELSAYSPFIPLNADDSALPATVFQFTVENRTDRPIEFSIAPWLDNAVCLHAPADAPGVRHSRVARDRGRMLISHRALPVETPAGVARPPIVLADFEGDGYGDWLVSGEAFGQRPAAGTLRDQQAVSGFEGRGLVNTYLGGDVAQGTLTSPAFVINRRFINFLLGGGRRPGQTGVELMVDGRVVRSATGANSESLTWQRWDVSEFEGRTAQIRIVDWHSWGWGHVNVDQIELSDRPREADQTPLPLRPDFGTIVLAGGDEGLHVDMLKPLGRQMLDGYAVGGLLLARDNAIASFSQTLRPMFLSQPRRLQRGEKQTVTFVLAWHMPNTPRGHAYAARFHDAGETAHYVLDNVDRLSRDTRLWRDTFYDSTLPRWLLERIHATVSNLATGTCQWWADGRFWAWEGVGCCSGTCTHVWNYAQALARLFPELERSVRERQDLGAALHPDGLVGFRGQQNRAYAADGQAGTVLKCYREHRMSADDEFLERNWPAIRMVLDFLIARDDDRDGLLDDNQPNTYDIDFVGPNTFVGSLYLAALRAGEEMARRRGESAYADELRAIFERGSRKSVECLWNGEYFTQDVDLRQNPENQYGQGCLSDQLFGQNWAHQLGLGYLYPPELVTTALRSIWKYNWAPDVTPHNNAHPPERWFVEHAEPGLFTCTWPKSAHLDRGVRYRDEVWTGIEYQVASHMIWEGLVEEALVMVRAIHDRYHPIKRNPYNEVECGDHYARALASWGVLLALCGFEYDGPRGHIGFAPRITPDDFRAPFTAAEGWGTLTQTRPRAAAGNDHDALQQNRIELRWGMLRVRSLGLALASLSPAGAVSVRVTHSARQGPRPVGAVHALDGTRLTVQLHDPLTITAGDFLHVDLAASTANR